LVDAFHVTWAFWLPAVTAVIVGAPGASVAVVPGFVVGVVGFVVDVGGFVVGGAD
jgi:hypothetical protein